ncbi:MAG: hypothetical protein QGH11_06220 [Pirellulaceae bacterium]|nr:hypothetical protein [Pirellulaceae bacterium]
MRLFQRLRSLAVRQEKTASGPEIPVVRLGDAEYCLRRVGRVLPYGMQTATEISQLLRREEIPLDLLGDYESLLAAFERGEWKHLADKLSPLADRDPVASFLRMYITDRGGTLPVDFEGVIQLVSK